MTQTPQASAPYKGSAKDMTAQISAMPECAFVTAAGIGSRLRPYTDTLPKPLVRVKDRPILDYIFDSLQEAGIKRLVINTHYLSHEMDAYLEQQKDRPFEIIPIHEQTLLDTGGGIRQGLRYFDDKPFIAVSGDSFWSEGEIPALKRMASCWNPDKMDLLLMLQPLETMPEDSVGDYTFESESISEKPAFKTAPIKRSRDRTGSHMWTSVRICAPSLFEGTQADTAFSFLEMMDKAEQSGRLHGLEHDGQWFHISTADDLERLNNAPE